MANEFTQVKDQNNVVHPVCDSTARSSISGILDGTTIDSFADVESALSGKEDTLTFDETPTEDSTNPVKSGGVYDAIQDVYEANGVLGAKNLLPMTLDIIKSRNTDGTWSDNVYSINNGTFTINTDSDGSVTSIVANGTFNAVTWFYLAKPIAYTNSVFFNGLTSTGAYETFGMQILDNNGAAIEGIYQATDCLMSADTYALRIRIASGYTATNLTFYPMVRLATDSDDTYQPYAMTNKQLTTKKADNSVIAPVESSTTASQAYTTNDFFIMDGTLYKVISDITQGGTITENTNCTATTITEILTALLNA